MKCPDCDESIDSGDHYCRHCGFELPKRFSLEADDRHLISVAQDVAHRLLKHRKTTPDQTVGLKKALIALNELPGVTPGCHIRFGAALRYGGESLYIDFTISESAFVVSMYGYDKGSYSTGDWRVDLDGEDSRPDNLLLSVEEQVNEYLNLGADISVSDESEMEAE